MLEQILNSPMAGKFIDKQLQKIEQGLTELEENHLKEDEDRMTFAIMKVNGKVAMVVCPIKEIDGQWILGKPIKKYEGAEILSKIMSKDE